MSKPDMNQMNDLQLRILEKEQIECRDVQKLFCDYIEMDLPCTLRARLHAHIKRCPECQEFESSYREVIQLAGAMKPKQITAGVQNRLRRSLNARLGINLPLVK